MNKLMFTTGDYILISDSSLEMIISIKAERGDLLFKVLNWERTKEYFVNPDNITRIEKT